MASLINTNTSLPPSAPTPDGCTQRSTYGCRDAPFAGPPHLHIAARAFAAPNHVGMPRGRQWTYSESAHLAEAWTYASTDSIAGIDQTSAHFWLTVMKQFIKLNPNHNDSNGRYGDRVGKAPKKQFVTLQKDIQLFSKSYRLVLLSNPTAATAVTAPKSRYTHIATP